jgi:hypothetical protein
VRSEDRPSAVTWMKWGSPAYQRLLTLSSVAGPRVTGSVVLDQLVLETSEALVADGGGTAMTKHGVVVGVTGRDDGSAALRFAAEHAALIGSWSRHEGGGRRGEA